MNDPALLALNCGYSFICEYYLFLIPLKSPRNNGSGDRLSRSKTLSSFSSESLWAFSGALQSSLPFVGGHPRLSWELLLSCSLYIPDGSRSLADMVEIRRKIENTIKIFMIFRVCFILSFREYNWLQIRSCQVFYRPIHCGSVQNGWFSWKFFQRKGPPTPKHKYTAQVLHYQFSMKKHHNHFLCSKNLFPISHLSKGFSPFPI